MFRDIRHWVFDLDNTLYDAESHIFCQFGRREEELLKRLHANENMNHVKERYIKNYGSLMNGFHAEKLLHPKEFLDFVHDVELSGILPCLDTASGIKSLQGNKIIFTNGPRFFAEIVLEKLGLLSLFDDIYTIEDSNYIPKPVFSTYIDFIEKKKILPSASCMIEDSIINLKPAHQLGIKTVWLNRHDISAAEYSSHVYHATDNLIDWLKDLGE